MIGTPQPLEIGLCDWSLHITDEPSLSKELARFNVRAAQIALGNGVALPENQQQAWVDGYIHSPILISAGCVGFPGEDYSTLAAIKATGGFVPDSTFDERFKIVEKSAKIAQRIGLQLFSAHAGFIPDKSDTAAFNKLLDKLRKVADMLEPLGLVMVFETGQETADTLATFLGELKRPNIGVNFDPANMVLYNKGDPVASVHRLAPYIKHVHAKDAKRNATVTPGEWAGLEVPLGTGDARLPEVIDALWKVGYRGVLSIEREAGNDRVNDITKGVAFLREAVKKAQGK